MDIIKRKMALHILPLEKLHYDRKLWKSKRSVIIAYKYLLHRTCVSYIITEEYDLAQETLEHKFSLCLVQCLLTFFSTIAVTVRAKSIALTLNTYSTHCQQYPLPTNADYSIWWGLHTWVNILKSICILLGLNVLVRFKYRLNSKPKTFHFTRHIIIVRPENI